MCTICLCVCALLTERPSPDGKGRAQTGGDGGAQKDAKVCRAQMTKEAKGQGAAAPLYRAFRLRSQVAYSTEDNGCAPTPAMAPADAADRAMARASLGDMPNAARNARLKCALLAKPVRAATSATRKRRLAGLTKV